jgi:hypothetical protein
MGVQGVSAQPPLAAVAPPGPEQPSPHSTSIRTWSMGWNWPGQNVKWKKEIKTKKRGHFDNDGNN